MRSTAQPRGPLALHDSMQRSDLMLRHARIRRIVVTCVFAAILGVGFVALLANLSDRFPMIPIAVILLGGINGAISAVGLWHVIGEQRMRERERRAAGARPVSDGAFDQTNGVVDLGRDAEQADPDEESDRARRLSSMHAAGIAYGNGTR